jgi:RNA-directed DNA polymerase
MKRIGNLYEKIISIDNLKLADKKARKGKACQCGIQIHDRNQEGNIQLLHQMLGDHTYKTSPYDTFIVRDPKERLVYRLPYFPDRIAHHAVMNHLERIFVATFTVDTFSCIKKRGIHAASKAVQLALKDAPGTTYCLKMDIRKFYPSLDHEILKQLLRKKFKDTDLLWLLDEIIDSAPGVPIGNYLSQYFANFYLSYFDHWLKEEKKVRYYFRYADDLVILASSKQELHQLLADIRTYLHDQLKLEIKKNYQVFPVASRGIDFVGYVHYHTHTALRKSIKKACARKMAGKPTRETVASYNGWLSHGNCKHLKKRLFNDTSKRLQGLGNKTA